MEKKNYVLCDGKFFFWPWHSVANLKAELLNGEQLKITFYALEKFFLSLALCCQPASRTSQWRTKNDVLCDRKSFCCPWHYIANLKVELLNGEKNYFLCDGKVIFWPWHSVANLKVEIFNGEQKKLRSMGWEKFFFVLGTLVPQPENRTSQWRIKKNCVLCDRKSFFCPWHSGATT
jgi:hypothetical protein